MGCVTIFMDLARKELIEHLLQEVDSEINCEDNLSRQMILRELAKHSETVEVKLDVDCRVADLEITHNLIVVTNTRYLITWP